MSNILSYLIVATLFLIGLPSWLHFEDAGIQNMKTSVAASQMKVFTEAAQEYVEANYPAIEAVATGTSPTTITPAMLQATGFLAPSFVSANPWTQSYTVQVLQPSPGTLQALVLTTGGVAIPQGLAPVIAAQSGAEGGFIPYPNQYGTLTNTVAEGSYGGWQVSMQYYANPGQGHLASLVALNNGQLQTDFLNRSAVPGEPQANTMNTGINMSGNNLQNAGTVSAGSVTAGTISASGTLAASNFTYPGTAAAYTGCSTTGAVAANSNGSGQILSCSGGQWQPPPSNPNPGFNSGLAGSFSSPGTYVNNPGYGLCFENTGSGTGIAQPGPISWGGWGWQDSYGDPCSNGVLWG